MFGEKLIAGGSLVKIQRLAAPQYGNARHLDIHKRGIKLHTRASRSRKDAAPVRIAAGESCFYQRRSRDGLRDALRCCFRLRAAHFDFDDTLRAFAIGDDLQRKRAANFFQRRSEHAMRRGARFDRRCAGFAVGEDHQRVIRRRVAIDADGVEREARNVTQRFLQERRSNRCIRGHKREHRRHVRMDHPRAFGAAHEMNSLPGHLEGSRGGFRTCIRCADRQRSFRERTRRGAAKTRDDRQRAQNFFQRQRHANDAGRTDKQFLRRAAKPLRCFGNRAHRRGVARFTGGAVGVARVHHNGAHAAFRRAHIFFGNENRCGNHKILREDRGGRSRHVARKNCQVERAGFLQSASGRGEAKPARQGSFRKCVLHQRDIRMTSAPLPEETSDPPQPRRRIIAVSLLGLHSWFGSYFGGFLVETSFQIRDGVTNAFGRRTAGNFFRSQRRFHAEALREISFKCRRNVLECLERECRPGYVLFLGFVQHFADDVVRLAKGNAFVHQVVGCFGGKQRGIGCRSFQSVGVEFCGSDSARSNREHVRDLIVRSEERFFVLLQVALVARWQAFQRREQTEQRSGDPAGFAADQLPGVWIFFLRHQAAAGGKFVGKNDIRKFLRSEEYKIFGEPGKMRSDAGEREKIVEREVPVADGVQAVPGHARKAELARNRVAIDGERISSKRAGTHWTRVRARRSVLQASHVARESFRMSQQKVRE